MIDVSVLVCLAVALGITLAEVRRERGLMSDEVLVQRTVVITLLLTAITVITVAR